MAKRFQCSCREAGCPHILNGYSAAEIKQMLKKTTSERLTEALEALNDPKLADMIRKARLGYYDDYETWIATPQLVLIGDLYQAGHPDMIRRVMAGEFEATKEEGKAWFKREGRQLLENQA